MADLIPSGAKLHARLSGGIHLLDVVDLLERGKPRWSSVRTGGDPRFLFGHHSGARGRAGFPGLAASARFVVRRRNFPTCAYALWLPEEDLFDYDRNRVCFLALRKEDRGWHTGRRANDDGEASCFQGNKTTHPLSKHQEECAEAVIPWWAEQNGQSIEDAAEWLGWHSIGDRWGGRRKRACPGNAGEAFFSDYVAQASRLKLAS